MNYIKKYHKAKRACQLWQVISLVELVLFVVLVNNLIKVI